MAPSKRRSKIWDYFNICTADNRFSICTLCEKLISRGGDGKNAGISSMRNHLKFKHAKQYASITPSATTNTYVYTDNLFNTESGDCGENQSISYTMPRQIETMVKIEPISENKLHDSRDEQSKRYHYAIAEMIALDIEPVSVIESVGFRRLINEILPFYTMPTCSYLEEKIFPDIYDRIHAKITKNLSQIDTVTVTANLRNCSNNRNSFLNVTAHWLSPELTFSHAVLVTKLYDSLQRDMDITNDINNGLKLWNISEDKIFLLIHNTEGKLIKGTHVTGYNTTSCFINFLEQTINIAHKSQPEVEEMINAARALTSHLLVRSTASIQEFKTINQINNLPDAEFVKDDCRRWISTYHLLLCLIEQKHAVCLYANDNKYLSNLTMSQWELLEQYIKLLKPFEELIKFTSTKVSCVSEVVPHLITLIKYLGKDDTATRAPSLSSMRRTLITELESCDLKNNDKYLVATFLDPRFKTSFLGLEQVNRVKQRIISEALEMGCDDCSSDKLPLVQMDIKTDTNDVPAKDHETFWNYFDELASSNKQCLNACNNENAIALEIENYLKTVRLDRNNDPLKWWSANTKEYPNLVKFVQIYHSSPSTCIINNTLYSQPGIKYEDINDRLLTLSDEKIAFIHYNLPLINFEY